MAYWLSQYPALADVGLAGYGAIASNTTIDGINYGGFQGIFVLPVLSPENTTDSIASAFEPILTHINTTWPGYFQFETNAAVFPSFYDWWIDSNGPDDGGVEVMVGSRLLPAEALTANLTALKVGLQGFLNPQEDGISVDFVSGKGVWNAVPRGGSDAVNPAWRKAVIHMSKYQSACDPDLHYMFLVKHSNIDLNSSDRCNMELPRPRWQSGTTQSSHYIRRGSPCPSAGIWSLRQRSRCI